MKKWRKVIFCLNLVILEYLKLCLSSILVSYTVTTCSTFNIHVSKSVNLVFQNERNTMGLQCLLDNRPHTHYVYIFMKMFWPRYLGNTNLLFACRCVFKNNLCDRDLTLWRSATKALNEEWLSGNESISGLKLLLNKNEQNSTFSGCANWVC